MTDLLKKTMCELGRAIETEGLDPVDITSAYLDAAESHPNGTRIYARLTKDRALAEAQAASSRAKLGVRRGLLDGVPVSWKDLFDTAGTATEAGSALLKGRVPAHDAEMVCRASSAGLVGLGKTHMSELAFSGLGLNPITATPPCINDAGAVSGGSSSGAAASVAFNVAPGAIGSDTGGSVRIPAAWNDLVGLKTTAARLSLKGTVPLAASFDTVGPLVKSVEDAAHVFAILDGAPVVDLRGAEVKGKRFLILESVAFDDIRAEPLAGFQSVVARLQDAGAIIERGTVKSVEQAMELSATLFPAEAYAEWRDEIEANPNAMFKPILERFRAGGAVSAVDFISGWQKLRQYRAEYLAQTAGYDAVILPTAPILPPNVERLLSDNEYYVTENLLALRNTRIGNLMGLTGLTLPTGVPSCGFLIQTAPNTEEKLLRLGSACESVLA
ncbi:aspartyl-tRNA(Asn)/glutamyl-tRNA(Gln) amidotransferase subunit A [Pacificibacter maritimus]|uniref:Aspartyl-tRNA(Asn)/glutamyl-tRNA(Gln) amidotransferase subunit A n=1 Tax=Pacificibacter maritimus TaxID=762213 RepID=A0A3N4U914_9RHOB|nr:amidase family protein [Pacificibacter maritimus]RPE64855.1 aspartyl-tRNA(Asn)/glutamyl-tRNA(Gln) amidotransferase subunit A [Pacificibacter maritimus]